MAVFIAMQYRHVPNANFEDFSCGRFIYQIAGFPNFPVRLACEIFLRCYELLNEPKVSVYDPCCGGAYMLTVLGFMYNEKISALYGSDVSEEACSLAERNLGLLTHDGLSRRKKQLNAHYEAYGKASHLDAIKSADNLAGLIKNLPGSKVFLHDIVKEAPTFPVADIIIADVPYGKLSGWSSPTAFALDKMLDNLKGSLRVNALAAICSDKGQKINNPGYKRVERFQVGRRKIEILRLLRSC